MKYTQLVDPLGNLFISALIASIPILVIFWALIIRKMKGYLASLLTLIVAIAISVFAYGMPLKLSALSALYGAMYGFFPICWIIIGAVFIFNLTVKSGQFEVIKHFMASITPDRRLQAILIAFSFGAFLEGATGFGAPIAISAAMLVGLGFNPLYAAGLCLIANTAPVAFGAIGTPIITAARVSDLPDMAISQLVGRTLPVLSVIVPLYLIVLMSGFRKSLEVMPAILVAGVSFAFFQWYSSNYLGPMLPDVVAGLASIIAMMLLLKFWKPKNTWRFKEEPPQTFDTTIRYTPAEIFRAWSPFIVMTTIVIFWGMAPVKEILNATGYLKFDIPGLQGSFLQPDGSPLVIKPFELNFFSTPGSGLLVAGLLSIPLLGLSIRQGALIYLDTWKQLKYPIITITSILGFAFVANNSAMSMTMAMALAGTGALFPFFSPVLGWLGVFLTGSDTSSNALFSKLQYNSAETIGVDPLITVSANASGGVTGKMISPQSIAIGSAAVGLVGKESDLFRFTFKHSFIMLAVICLLTVMQAYVIEWIVPDYTSVGNAASAVASSGNGAVYLIALALILLLIMGTVWISNRKKKESTLVQNTDH